MSHSIRTPLVPARHVRRTGAILSGTSLVVALLAAALPAAPVLAQEEPAVPQEESADAPGLDIAWVVGPAEGSLGDMATIRVPEGYVFAGADDTRKIMEASQNLVSGDELGFLAPAEDDWFVVFEFEEIGYVKDDEGAKLDADAILKVLREGTSRGNEMRKERGWPTMEIAGWAQPPHYDVTTNNLEWATRIVSAGGGTSVNYNTRLLGRKGVMSATLVVNPERLDATLPAFKTLVGGHAFQTGHRYAEFKAGDKVAQYGLTALITGGAVAAAIKIGLFKKFWKLIVVAVAGLAAALRKVFIRSEKAPPQPAA
jgi:uncharacterized membrane-anchored protein